MNLQWHLLKFNLCLLICALVLTGCSIFGQVEVKPISQISFPGKLIFSDLNSKTHTRQIFEIAQGKTPSLLWESPTTENSLNLHCATTPGGSLIVSPKHSFVIDGKVLVNLSNGKISDIEELVTETGTGACPVFSPDEKYLAKASSLQGYAYHDLASMSRSPLLNPKCKTYGASVRACLGADSIFWLGSETLIFINDKGLIATDYEFPETIVTELGTNYYRLNSEDGMEVSIFDLQGKALNNLNSKELLTFLNSDPLDSESVFLDPHKDIWVSKLDLRQGIYLEHQVDAPAQSSPGEWRSLAPQGRYYLRFPVDIVDLETNQIINLGLGNIIVSEENDKDKEYQFTGQRITFKNCAWNHDGKQAVCAFSIMNFENNQRVRDKTILVFVSTEGNTHPIFAELDNMPFSMFGLLEAWLP